MDKRRIFLIVLDSFGIGGAKDAKSFGDEGANTLKTVSGYKDFKADNLKKMGLFNIDKIDFYDKALKPSGAYARMQESSNGKDTTIGHWEMAGIISKNPLPTYPDGFPDEVVKEFEKRTGRKVICNKPYSGTEVIKDYGNEHMETGALIVYTSADSVFQIAAHEEIVPLNELYRYCEIAREMLQGEHGVGRVIARPFVGEKGNFVRSANRHDYSLVPPKKTMLNALEEAGYDTVSVGKISDIFAASGISKSLRTKNNADGMDKTLSVAAEDFNGLCFINLVDCDMIYGHRRDVAGYAKAISDFDLELGKLLEGLREKDIVMITADHGCDPAYKGTDHTREDVMFLACGKDIKENINLGTRKSFADIAATILDIFELDNITDGISFKNEIIK